MRERERKKENTREQHQNLSKSYQLILKIPFINEASIFFNFDYFP